MYLFEDRWQGGENLQAGPQVLAGLWLSETTQGLLGGFEEEIDRFAAVSALGEVCRELGGPVACLSAEAGFELADSRIYLEDSDAPLDTTLINPLDFLQAYVHVTVPDAFAEGANLQLRAGRQTIDLGGRRLLARNRFRNTINAFSGVSVQWVGPRQDVARAFVTVPVQRRPTLLEALAGNAMEPDSELSSSIFWGLFYGSRPRADALRADLANPEAFSTFFVKFMRESGLAHLELQLELLEELRQRVQARLRAKV